ncbi:J domain-containing protein [Hydrogenimonas urashimensis]|uniref:J domain-containing protein n=1 Tax=Hydrogenimonas urashimensis TaxID=2740515 RepID=UPI0019167905|nr:J domain-containing protein [Hydrogenimonas urashimensis]
MSKAYDKIHEALDILGLPTRVSLKEITDRYRYLASGKHPDVGGETEEMARINEAYKILKTYIENYRFSFSEEEIARQFPEDSHAKRFRF